MGNHKCKGMRDLLPEDTARFRRIEDVFRTCCHGWGYQEVRTPTLEYLYLFTATGTLTPAMLSKVYSFLDWDGWSGERVVLRPDGTIPVARLYVDNLGGQKSARLFYVTNIFAFEESGRESRERWQCGAEFFGGTKPAADVEIILLAQEVIRKLSLSNVELHLSHAGLIQALVKEFKLSPMDEGKMTSAILEGDWQVLTKAKSAHPKVDGLVSALLGLKGKSSGFLHNIKASFPKASRQFKSSLEDFISVTASLDAVGCRYQIDIAATRGFEYYTGVCFHFLAAGQKIGGGGRYDNLVPLMNGKRVPACGFALYVDPIMKLLPPDKQKKARSGILVKGQRMTPQAMKMCFDVAETLRNSGHPARIVFTAQEESDFRWVVLVSGREASPFVLRDRLLKRTRYRGASLGEILTILNKG